jgi:hypothetical protein
MHRPRSRTDGPPEPALQLCWSPGGTNGATTSRCSIPSRTSSASPPARKGASDPSGLLDSLKKALAERALNAEMDHHLSGDKETATIGTAMAARWC